MKTKEEIEQLAESICHQMCSSNVFVVVESKGFINGYTQCQEDMADESIRFADWIGKEHWCQTIRNSVKGQWVNCGVYKTTSELYKLFLNKQE